MILEEPPVLEFCKWISSELLDSMSQLASPMIPEAMSEKPKCHYNTAVLYWPMSAYDLS